MGAVPKPIHLNSSSMATPAAASPPEEQPFEQLTAAEMRVMELLQSHLTIGVIARQLYIAHSTAKTHSLSIYRKLKVCSRAAAVRRAIELRILPDPADPPSVEAGTIERSLRLVNPETSAPSHDPGGAHTAARA